MDNVSKSESRFPKSINHLHDNRFCFISCFDHSGPYPPLTVCLLLARKMSNSSTKDKVEGNLHQAKGSVKESVGHAVGNDKMFVILLFLFVFCFGVKLNLKRQGRPKERLSMLKARSSIPSGRSRLLSESNTNPISSFGEQEISDSKLDSLEFVSSKAHMCNECQVHHSTRSRVIFPLSCLPRFLHHVTLLTILEQCWMDRVDRDGALASPPYSFHLDFEKRAIAHEGILIPDSTVSGALP